MAADRAKQSFALADVETLAVHRGRSAHFGARRAGQALEAALREVRRKKGLDLGELTAGWREIVGPELAALCAPEKLTGKAGARTLHLAAAGPAALVLRHREATLLARVNVFAGTDQVAKLVFLQRGLKAAAANVAAIPAGGAYRPLTAADRARLSRALASVENPVLRDALERLGTEIFGRIPAETGTAANARQPAAPGQSGAA